MNNLNCDDIRQTLAAGATLLDVRTTDEFIANSLSAARNIPLALLPSLADEHMEKHKPVYIYCRSGGRAIIAERILAGLGFTDVTSIGSIDNFAHCH